MYETDLELSNGTQSHTIDIDQFQTIDTDDMLEAILSAIGAKRDITLSGNIHPFLALKLGYTLGQQLASLAWHDPAHGSLEVFNINPF